MANKPVDIASERKKAPRIPYNITTLQYMTYTIQHYTT